MALFFNMKTLEELAAKDYNKLFALLDHHYHKRTIPKKLGEKYPPAKVSLVGYSFLLNPASLLIDKTTDILFRVQYLKLAALRDYSLYTRYKYKGLQLSSFPDLLVDSIKFNPLLKLTSTDLLFKYEESY